MSIVHCSHVFTHNNEPITCVRALLDGVIVVGGESGYLYVYSVDSFTMLNRVKAHDNHVFSILYVRNGENMLVSVGGDGNIKVWSCAPDFSSFQCIKVLRSTRNCGDVQSIAYCTRNDHLYLGCKNTQICWFKLSTSVSEQANHNNNGTVKDEGEYGCPSVNAFSKRMEKQWTRQDSRFFQVDPIQIADVPAENVFVILEEQMHHLAHRGSVNQLAVIESSESSQDVTLVSVGGDGCINIWRLSENGSISIQKSIQASKGSVITLEICRKDGLMYAGLQRGELKLYDLDTFQLLRTVQAHNDDIIAICCHSRDYLLTAAFDGHIRMWNKRFECLQIMSLPDSYILSLDVGSISLFFSTELNGYVRVWSVGNEIHDAIQEEQDKMHEMDNNTSTPIASQNAESDVSNDIILALEEFISFQSISGDKNLMNACWDAAKFLRILFKDLGANTRLVANRIEGKNPVVMAKFNASVIPSSQSANGGSTSKTLLFYGHYDVTPVKRNLWHSDPFSMSGRDGYLHGRGVSDNKGPLLSMMFAVRDLYQQKALGCNVVFVIEGEEESGSSGFYDAIQDNVDFIGDKIDLILLSNSYWYDDDTPCITYGLRGVVHAKIEITGHVQDDVHSGVHGGSLDEPLDDMVKILSNVYDRCDKTVRIDGFSDNVAPLTDEESKSYRTLIEYDLGKKELPLTDENIDKQLRQLKAKWREPTFTIHQIQVGTNLSNTIIPRQVTAHVSMRIVPNQQMDDVIQKLEQYLKNQFLQLKTRNTLTLTVSHRANWWLGKVAACKHFKAAHDAINKVWNKSPLLIREGGSIPAIPWLEQYFNACVVHIPLGQSSDNAHLPNERIRVLNLIKGKEVLQNFLINVTKY
ncbi:hypothetical protein MP228_000990 [Amoeboaphelidium protococcarum]|nr:hypothetical protein MP228_000990 [Amoeboaphelidium protococcarum]